MSCVFFFFRSLFLFIFIFVSLCLLLLFLFLFLAFCLIQSRLLLFLAFVFSASSSFTLFFFLFSYPLSSSSHSFPSTLFFSTLLFSSFVADFSPCSFYIFFLPFYIFSPVPVSSSAPSSPHFLPAPFSLLLPPPTFSSPSFVIPFSLCSSLLRLIDMTKSAYCYGNIHNTQHRLHSGRKLECIIDVLSTQLVIKLL